MLKLVVSELKFDVGKPTLLVGHPIHPRLEDLPGSGDVPEHLLHVNVLVPQLINPRQVVTGSVTDIPGVVNKLVLHTELGPERMVPAINLHSSLPQLSPTVAWRC